MEEHVAIGKGCLVKESRCMVDLHIRRIKRKATLMIEQTVDPSTSMKLYLVVFSEH